MTQDRAIELVAPAAAAGTPVVILGLASGGGYPIVWDLVSVAMVGGVLVIARTAGLRFGRHASAATGLLVLLASLCTLLDVVG